VIGWRFGTGLKSAWHLVTTRMHLLPLVLLLVLLLLLVIVLLVIRSERTEVKQLINF